MKTQILLATALVALALAPSPAAGAGGVTVHFALTLGHHLSASHVACDLVVPSGANGGDVLDAATAAGCISGWQYESFGARFVTCIDGLCGQTVATSVPGVGFVGYGTFWALYVNEALPGGGTAGIDDISVQDGDTVEFTYADWSSPFLTP